MMAATQNSGTENGEAKRSNDERLNDESLNDERTALQRRRSIAIALSLGVLVALFYIATLVKMGGAGSSPKTPDGAAKVGAGKAGAK